MKMSVIVRLSGVTLLALALAAPLKAQERRGFVVGSVGGANLGHADSEMGDAAIFGGAVGVHLTPRLVVELDVHHAGVSHVFGRAHHDFTQTTLTPSLLFRSSPQGRVHLLAGGGIGFQRAHTEVDDPQFVIDRTEAIRMWHGRGGVDWDVSPRVFIRTEGVLWFGAGLDWVVGGRGGIGFRF